MANTGNKQAIIAYKVSPNGDPVDVDGVLTSVSGKRQAIALLTGQTNPNPTLYEVELYFNPKGLIKGEPSISIDLEYCPVSIFIVDKTTIVLYPAHPTEVINVFATFGWTYLGPDTYATATPSIGIADDLTAVNMTRTATLGQGYVSFKDNSTGELKKVYVINTDALGWILETGFWNNLRFWEANGIWNY